MTNDTEALYREVRGAVIEGDYLTQILFDEIRQIDVKTGKVLQQVECPNVGGLFEIYSIEDGYIIHGELELFRYDKHLNRIWDFSGRDIFATVDGRKAFWLEEDTIHCRDWLGWHYVLDLDGKLLCEKYEKSPGS